MSKKHKKPQQLTDDDYFAFSVLGLIVMSPLFYFNVLDPIDDFGTMFLIWAVISMVIGILIKGNI